MDAQLKELVHRYRVTWATRPEMASNGHSVAPIGYLIDLNAIPDHPEHAEAIACPDCAAVEDALQRLVLALAAPGEVTHVGRGERQIGTAHDTRPEVSATVSVLHRDGRGANRPPDAEQQKRMKEIVGNLRELGAQESHWNERAAAPAS
jgi:hypothetical protein